MEYSDFPPVATFLRILQSAPGSALLYVKMWQLAPKAKSYNVPIKNIRNFFLISKTVFRNHLLALGRLDLLSFKESDEGFFIEFLKDA